MKYSIRKYGDPVLRTPAKPVFRVDDGVRTILANMLETVKEDGVGLAAQQVGQTLALCVIDIPEKADTDEAGVRLNPDVPMPLVMFNPEIVAESDELINQEEGCLSFPEIFAPVVRSWKVTVRYMDENEREHLRTFQGLVARAAQHEIDHLNAVLFIDRITSIKRVALAAKLNRLKQSTLAALGL